MNTLLKQKKDTLEFHKLAVELKKWFEDRNIDTGYTDTNVGHLALLVQKKIKEAREEVNKNELHNKIHKEVFEAGYRKGLKEAGEKIYTKQEVLESIERAFWNGVEEGEIEGAGEYFSAEDYLPDTKQEMGERWKK